MNETATANTKKQLNVGNISLDSPINMGDKGVNYVVFEKGSTASGVIDKGTNAGVIVFEDNKADLSNITVKNYDSTKDTLATTKSLSDYLEKTNDGATSNFLNNTTGKFGKDLMANSGSLASTKKDGFYQTQYGEVDAKTGNIKKKTLVVSGSDTPSSGDFSNSDVPIFAMTDNNDVSDTVKGSAKGDSFVAGVDDEIDGGEGDDIIRAYKSKVKLATNGEGNDSILNWDEYDLKNKTNDTLSMDAGKNIKDLKLLNFSTVGGNISLKLSDGSANAGASIMTTKTSGDTFRMKVNAENKAKNAGILANIVETGNANDDYVALMVNTTAKNGVTISNEDSEADAYFGLKGFRRQVSFGNSDKRNIFLGASGNGEEWGDMAVYSDILNVKTSTVGNSLLINGTGENATLEAGGANDSLWGGIGGSNDLLISNNDSRTYIAAGYDNGKDTVKNFKYGLDANGENQAIDAAYFLNGVSYVSAEGGAFTAGDSESSNLTFESDGESVKDLTFGCELNGELTTARVDMTNGGDKNIAFDENATWYIGQGETSGIDFGERGVKFGYDSKYGLLNVGTLNAANVSDGSLINGSNDINQTVIASSKGTSSICGGFYGNFENGNNDALIGGGDGNDTFYVGKNMGSDDVTNVVSGDTVVFLATKVSDITGINTASDGFGVNFNDTQINVKFAGGEQNVTAVLDDGKYIYNGTEFVKIE